MTLCLIAISGIGVVMVLTLSDLMFQRRSLALGCLVMLMSPGIME